MKNALAVANAIAATLNAAGILSETVEVDLYSRWTENASSPLKPTLQLVSVRKEKIDRTSTAIRYAFLFRRAALDLDGANAFDNPIDIVADYFGKRENRYINVDGVGLIAYGGFIYNAPTRTTTNNASLEGCYDSALLEADGVLFQTALLEFYRLAADD